MAPELYVSGLVCLKGFRTGIMILVEVCTNEKDSRYTNYNEHHRTSNHEIFNQKEVTSFVQNRKSRYV